MRKNIYKRICRKIKLSTFWTVKGTKLQMKLIDEIRPDCVEQTMESLGELNEAPRSFLDAENQFNDF